MEESILNKHSLAVHSSAELSLLERKITNALLFNAFNNSENEEEYRIRVCNLLNLIGIKTRNYTQIYLAIRNIATTLIEWGILKTDSFKGDLTGITFLEMYRICNGLITYRLPKELKNLLYNPNQYAKIRMSSVAAMTSSYGVALYENCASYSGWGDTGWININHFRKLMGVAEKYPIYRDFKRRVVQSAVADVNKNSEFSLELIERKEGRNTAKIKFLIKPKKKEVEPISKEKLVIKELTSLGVPKVKINDWISKKPLEFIVQRIENIKNNVEIKNKMGFLIASIEKDYKLNSKLPDVHNDLKDAKEKHRALKCNILSDWFEKLPSAHWKELCDLLIQYVENISIIVHKEFCDRLPSKDYRNYKNTTDDLHHFTEQILLFNPSKIIHLEPPKLPSLLEYMEQKSD